MLLCIAFCSLLFICFFFKRPGNPGYKTIPYPSYRPGALPIWGEKRRGGGGKGGKNAKYHPWGKEGGERAGGGARGEKARARGCGARGRPGGERAPLAAESRERVGEGESGRVGVKTVGVGET